jgi:hypothetical protein
METRRDMRLPLGVVVGFLALVGVGASATHYLQEPYNPGFLEYPTIVALHVVLGGVYLALAPFQFVKRIRSRHLGYHRRVGRLLVAVGLVAGDHRPLRRFVPLHPRQGLPPRPGWAGGVAQGVDDPGVRRRLVYRHDAPDLRPRAHDRVHPRADHGALGVIVCGGVRPEHHRSRALDPRHPQKRRARGRRGEISWILGASQYSSAERLRPDGIGGHCSSIWGSRPSNWRALG